MAIVTATFVQRARAAADRLLRPVRTFASWAETFLSPEDAGSEGRGPASFTPDRLILFALLALVLAIAGSIHGSNTYTADLENAFFYQNYFTPAVNLACSGEFARFTPDPETLEFMQGNVDSLPNCENVRNAESFDFWAPFDNQSTYLYWLTALIWKIFGVNWSSLAILAGLFSGLFSVAAFMFFRVFSPSSLIAAAAAMLLLLFTPVSAFIPDLRDFSKAPFTLLPLALVGLAVTRNLSRKAIFWIFVAAGLCVAFGRGFRPDVIVTVPIILVVAPLILLRKSAQSNIQTVARALAGFIAALIVGSLPIQISAALHADTGSLTPHFFNLGYAEPFFEGNLGMPSPGHSTSRFYDDSIISEHAYTYQPGETPDRSVWNRDAYDEVSWNAFFEFTSATPHDAFMRAFYALKTILQHSPLAERLPGILLVCFFLLGSLVLPRRGVFLLVVAGSLIAIATLQFDTRHYFHLFCLAPAVVLLCLGGAQQLITDMRHKQLIRPDYASITILAGLIAGISLLTAVLDPFLSKLQTGRLNGLQADYESLEWKPLDVTFTDNAFALTSLPATEEMVMMKVVRSAESGQDLRINRSVRLAPAQGSSLLLTEEHETLSMLAIAGYQAVSEPIAIEEVEGQRQAEIYLYVDVVVTGDRIAFGAQSLDQSRWIGSPGVVEAGAYKGFFKFPVDSEEPYYRIVIEKLGTTPGDLIINRLYALPSLSACLPGNITYSQQYRSVGGSVSTGWPELMEPADVSTYYFPAAFAPAQKFEGLFVEGTKTECITTVAWAPIPENAPLIELMLADGRREQPARRGDLGEVLHDILFETIQQRKNASG